jgi:hypothetical protein
MRLERGNCCLSGCAGEVTVGGLGGDIYVSAGRRILHRYSDLPEPYPPHPCHWNQPSSAPNHYPAMIDMALIHARGPLPCPPTPTAFDSCQGASLVAEFMPPSGLACQPPAYGLERLQDKGTRSQGSAKPTCWPPSPMRRAKAENGG